MVLHYFLRLKSILFSTINSHCLSLQFTPPFKMNMFQLYCYLAPPQLHSCIKKSHMLFRGQSVFLRTYFWVISPLFLSFLLLQSIAFSLLSSLLLSVSLDFLSLKFCFAYQIQSIFIALGSIPQQILVLSHTLELLTFLMQKT